MDNKRKHDIVTKAIHGRRDESYRSGVFPIYQTSLFAVEETRDYDRYLRGDDDFYTYSRLHNPTIRNVEEKLAKLEYAEDGLLFASGMAAITSAILSVVQAGDTIVTSKQLYGTVHRFLQSVAPRFGIQTRFLPDEELYELHRHVPDAKLVYFETPINPTSHCLNMARVAKAAQQMGTMSIIDNTFASPINQNPIIHGVDMVVHSATKYIGGHSDLIAGAVLGSKEHLKKVLENRTLFGGCINPHSAYLLDRSLKTLPMRIAGHNTNAMTLAEFFAKDERVQRVFYPGLPDSPGHDIAAEQMHGFGGMLCIELSNLEAGKRFSDSLQVALNATSLGGTETLVSIPVLTSHAHINEAAKQDAGITEGMVRISVGLEAIDDLVADFDQALSAI